MLKNDGIIECEIEYSKCFSEFYDSDEIIRFRDNQLADMHYHNYTFVKSGINEARLRRIIEEEIALRLFEKANYCTFILNCETRNSMLYMLRASPEISRNGYYLFDISKFSFLNTLSGCTIEKVVNKGMIEDVLYCNLQFDEVLLGKDFCKRRCYRRAKEYLSNKEINSYVCYHNGKIIGNCDLFIHNGVAKIEDFVVLPTYQRKGYGSSILKELIGIAINENCHTIYLVADEYDTAKEMYLKSGFNKIGERVDLFFDL